MKYELPFITIEIEFHGSWWCKIKAYWLRYKSSIVVVEYPNESHCDQCDLQADCDWLHDRTRNYADCKAYPNVYRLPNKYQSE